MPRGTKVELVLPESGLYFDEVNDRSYSCNDTYGAEFSFGQRILRLWINLILLLSGPAE